MKIFQIVDNVCHWQTPYTSLAETYEKYPSDLVFVEAPDYVREQWTYDSTKEGDERFIKPEAPEGWVYDEATGQFMPELMPAQRLAEAQATKQNENNQLFAKFLEDHPLTWVDGKIYGVTLADQQEIALNITSYQVATMAGIQEAILEWHAIHEACTPWTLENLSALSLAIRNYIYPYYTLCQSYKTQIYACTTVEDVEAIQLTYNLIVPEEPSEEGGEETTDPTTPTDPEQGTGEDVTTEPEEPVVEDPITEDGTENQTQTSTDNTGTGETETQPTTEPTEETTPAQ